MNKYLEFLKTILEKHTDAETGKTDFDSVMNEFEKELPKNWITKEKFAEQTEQLNEAKTTLESLQKQNKDNESLQNEVNDWKSKYEVSVKDNAINTALLAAGAKDLDYAKFKLGEVKLDKDGNVKGLDHLVKDLKEKIPDYFQVETPKDPDDKGQKGYKPIDTKLGANSDSTYSMEQIQNMSTEEINANWEAVAASMNNNEGGQ
ncbi:phage scaffolding protein [Lactococcus protaetiae]|nr:phage scaffolding protein [Lactococcus protaetiae]